MFDLNDDYDFVVVGGVKERRLVEKKHFFKTIDLCNASFGMVLAQGHKLM